MFLGFYCFIDIETGREDIREREGDDLQQRAQGRCYDPMWGGGVGLT